MTAISLLLPDLRGGGAERVTLDLAYEFARQGYEVELVLKRVQGELLAEARSNFSIADLRCTRVRQVPPALWRYLRKRQPDALIAAMWPLTVIAPLARLLSATDCHVIVCEHGILSAQYSSWGVLHGLALRSSAWLGYRLAHARVGVSKGVADDMAALSRLSRDRFAVINNPVPARQMPTAAALAAADALWNTPPGARILTVGRLKAVKNHTLLLRAFAQIHRSNARLVVVGDGECGPELRRTARELGISDRVVFAGFESDPTPFYSTADLFVLSSDYEGFGNVIVEALACGTPVVSTDCPSGPREILAGGRYGDLVPVRNPDALASAITEALGRGHDSEKLRRRASAFAPARAAQRYLNLLFTPSGRAPSEVTGKQRKATSKVAKRQESERL